MKKLLVLLTMFFMVGAYQAQDTTDFVTNSNVEKLVDKYSTKLEAAIVSIAEALQQPAEYVYGIMVRQQYVKAFVGIFVLLMVIICMYAAIRYANNIEDWIDGDVEEGKPAHSLGGFIVCAAFSIIFALIFFIGGYQLDIIQGFVNPEYGAIQDIVKLIK